MSSLFLWRQCIVYLTRIYIPVDNSPSDDVEYQEMSYVLRDMYLEYWTYGRKGNTRDTCNILVNRIITTDLVQETPEIKHIVKKDFMIYICRLVPPRQKFRHGHSIDKGKLINVTKRWFTIFWVVYVWWYLNHLIIIPNMTPRRITSGNTKRPTPYVIISRGNVPSTIIGSITCQNLVQYILILKKIFSEYYLQKWLDQQDWWYMASWYISVHIIRGYAKSNSNRWS